MYHIVNIKKIDLYIATLALKTSIKKTDLYNVPLALKTSKMLMLMLSANDLSDGS